MKHLVCITVITSLFATQLLAATIDDARQALENLDALSVDLQGRLHLHMNLQADTLRSQLAQTRAELAEEIDQQIANITAKIAFLAENTQSTTDTNVDSCLGTAQADLQDFAAELQERVYECYGSMIMTGNSMLYATWARAWDDYDINYQCSRMGFVQCSNYEDASCADFVVNSIAEARAKMEKTYDLLQKDMTNEITSMTFPCTRMIAEELGLYPSLILNFVSTCLKSISAHTFINDARC